MTEKIKEKLYLILTGVVTGLANGFFGGGGGMIVVPLLTFLLKMKTKSAHATAIAIILPVSVISAIVYFIKGSFDFSVGLPWPRVWFSAELRARGCSESFLRNG